MSYSVREVSAMLGLSAGQIRSWAAKGLLDPELGKDGEMRFGFQDLVILRTAGELTAAHIPTSKIRRVLASVREQLPAGRSIAGVRIAADGERVVVRDGKTVWNPESGQSLFDFSVDEIAEKTKPIALAAVREARAREENDLDADAWYELASDLELTDPAEARTAYEKAVALDPSHVARLPPRRNTIAPRWPPIPHTRWRRSTSALRSMTSAACPRLPTPTAAPSSSIRTTQTPTTTWPAFLSDNTTRPVRCGI
jgi:DNA-binding transcriptional MerR regulator